MANILKTYALHLPKLNGEVEVLNTNQSVLLLGANGSGKTRLGAWVEMTSPQRNIVHRISAQKSLAMPDTTTPISVELAEKDLLFGFTGAETGRGHDWKMGNIWSSKPATQQLNDFEKLMKYLFSEQVETNAKYIAAQKNEKQSRIEPPETKLDLVKKLWEKIIPHRELILGGLRIQTQLKNNNEKVYNSSDMSDGERVIFYLISHCLAASNNGIIVIDEPELHLHKSVQIPLWNEIEKLRPDCLFVYLTHDIDFAASKETATRIWLKSFDGQAWDWEQLERDSNLPDQLLLEIIGNRKPVVFVEGTHTSFDTSLYRALLPSYLVIPVGSCTQVIQAVKAFKANTQLHNSVVYGIIDRDRRTEAEISNLEINSIYVLTVAEVENLFCTPNILKIVSEKLLNNIENDYVKVSTYIFKRLAEELDNQISLHVAGEIKFKLNAFNEKAKGEQALSAALEALISSINVATIYTEKAAAFNAVLSNQNLDQLLAIYNRKSLSAQASKALGLADGGLPEYVLRLAKSDAQAEVVNAVKKYFGNFAPLMK